MDAQPQNPSIAEIARSYPFRIGVYALITLLVFEGVYTAIRMYGAGYMGAENGPIEVAQLILAVMGAAGLFFAAWMAPIGRSGLVMCGAIVTYAAARESDVWFETFLFDDAYKWFVGLPMLVVVGGIAVADRRYLIRDVMWLMHHPAATLFTVAGVFLCFVCQVLDRPEMWVGLSDVAEVATTKALIEEFCELFAYLMIAFSGIEAALLMRRKQADAQADAGASETVETYAIAA